MTTLMRFDPFRELDRLSEQVMAGTRAPRTLPMTACRRGDQMLVWMDVPGADPTDVDVTVERNVVNIHAERRAPLQADDEILIDERSYGEYTRQLFLGDNMDASRVVAHLDAGVLSLSIPVAEESKPRQVHVEAGESQQKTVSAGTGGEGASQG
jgi:HSP20 family protein